MEVDNAEFIEGIADLQLEMQIVQDHQYIEGEVDEWIKAGKDVFVWIIGAVKTVAGWVAKNKDDIKGALVTAKTGLNTVKTFVPILGEYITQVKEILAKIMLFVFGAGKSSVEKQSIAAMVNKELETKVIADDYYFNDAIYSAEYMDKLFSSRKKPEVALFNSIIRSGKPVSEVKEKITPNTKRF